MRRFAIIEDNADFGKVVDWTFPNATFTHYHEVSQFIDLKFDVVFSDLRLKETWGIETIQKLREKTNSVIIVLTGLGFPYLSATDLAAFLEAGANEVFSKDVIRDPKFPEMVEAILQGKKVI